MPFGTGKHFATAEQFSAQKKRTLPHPNVGGCPMRWPPGLLRPADFVPTRRTARFVGPKAWLFRDRRSTGATFKCRRDFAAHLMEVAYQQVKRRRKRALRCVEQND